MSNRILLVEDDERIRASMRLALEDEGYEVDEAGSGEIGLEHFAEQPADVVLIDLMLPGMDGFECCRQLRRDERRARDHGDGPHRHPRRGGRARGRGRRLRHQALRGQGAGGPDPGPAAPGPIGRRHRRPHLRRRRGAARRGHGPARRRARCTAPAPSSASCASWPPTRARCSAGSSSSTGCGVICRRPGSADHRGDPGHRRPSRLWGVLG